MNWLTIASLGFLAYRYVTQGQAALPFYVADSGTLSPGLQEALGFESEVSLLAVAGLPGQPSRYFIVNASSVESMSSFGGEIIRALQSGDEFITIEVASNNLRDAVAEIASPDIEVP